MRISLLAGAVLACTTLPFAAQAEFVGGRAGLSHSAFTGDSDRAKSSADVQLEWAFGQSFSTQTDLGLSGLHALDDTALNFTTHLNWTFANGGTAGLFYGWDKVVGTEDFYGLEYATMVGNTHVDGYIAMIDEVGSNGTMAGVAGRMAMNDRFGLGASVDYMKSNGVVDGTRIGLNGDYAMGEATKLTGEIGRVSADDTAGNRVSDTYLKLGVDFAFGQKPGVSFGKRSLFNILPGL
ncbi:hypothetical protein [Gemmobacter serpentinus]|uniref:hypothetical protein n=1 Tax=Gemmobacter serpentinus TaxID=2652247 RepID=UPI00124E54F1|nr:hypothetical protein [Gemmobacter serpentinus]